MLENIAWANMIYQVLTMLVWIGVIFIIVSFFRNSNENKKRLKRIEEKIDALISKRD